MAGDKLDAATEQDLEDEQQHGGKPRDSNEKRAQRHKLAGDVFVAGDWLRQVNLERVRLPIVCNQACPGIDGDEEDEDALLVQELVERLFGRRQKRRLRDRRSQIELDSAHEEERPGEQQQTEEPPL